MKRMMILFAAAAMTMASLALAQAQDLAKASAVSLQTVGFAAAGAQVKDDLFAGTEKFATGATDVTEINLDPKMMGMVSGGKGEGSGLARKMKFMVIHTYTYDKAGHVSRGGRRRLPQEAGGRDVELRDPCARQGWHNGHLYAFQPRP